jgi:hypothetical protein
MEFCGALRLIGSSNARLTCLAVELRPKASFPLECDTCPLTLLSNRTLPCIPSQKTTIRVAKRMPAKAISISCAIGNNIVSRKCPDWILCFFAA